MTYRFQDLIQAHAADWQAYTQHEFVQQLGQAKLPLSSFQFYLQQDYLFLLQFTRAHALAVYKSRTAADLAHAYAGLQAIYEGEMQLHLDYCREWGISKEDLVKIPEARATVAYTRYVFDAGNRGDVLDIHVALAPCMVGYAAVADYLNTYPQTIRGESNPYEAWIATYEGSEFKEAVAAEVDWIDQRLADVSTARFNELSEIFHQATRLEIDFWQAGLDQAQ